MAMSKTLREALYHFLVWIWSKYIHKSRLIFWPMYMLVYYLLLGKAISLIYKNTRAHACLVYFGCVLPSTFNTHLNTKEFRR